MPDKLGEFGAVCGTALVVLIIGVISPTLFSLCLVCAAIVLIFGTLAIFGIK